MRTQKLTKAPRLVDSMQSVSFAMIGNCHPSTLDGHAAMLENETGRACRDPNGFSHFSQRFFERCSSGSPQNASAKSDLMSNFV